MTDAINVARPFFVYGTLRRGDYNYVKLLQGNTQAESVGWQLSGVELYDLGPYPIAVECSDVEAVIVGELMTVKPELYPKLLAELDELEMYSPAATDNFYWREVRQVRSVRGEEVEAWVYLVRPHRLAALQQQGAVLVQNGDWLDWVSQKSKTFSD